MGFMALVAILTSVIGAGYYLAIVKQNRFGLCSTRIFRNSYVNEAHMVGYVLYNRKGNTDKPLKKIPFKTDSITINSSLSSTISIITLLLILFIYVPGQ